MKKTGMFAMFVSAATAAHAYMSVAEVPENLLMEKFFMTVIYLILTGQVLAVLILYFVFGWAFLSGFRSRRP